jgi:hypothetical protein
MSAAAPEHARRRRSPGKGEAEPPAIDAGNAGIASGQMPNRYSSDDYPRVQRSSWVLERTTTTGLGACCTLPIRCAIADEASGWSPVIMTGIIPARRQASTDAAAAGRGGSVIATRATRRRPSSAASIGSGRPSASRSARQGPGTPRPPTRRRPAPLSTPRPGQRPRLEEGLKRPERPLGRHPQMVTIGVDGRHAPPGGIKADLGTRAPAAKLRPTDARRTWSGVGNRR